MVAIFARTLLTYLSMLLIVRLMGKRQIGELQMPEFISAILLSEVAAMPIADRDIPLLHGLLPLCVIGACEVVIAMLCCKSRLLRRLLDGKPIVLVQDGRYVESNLLKSRVSKEEINAQVREKGFASIDEVASVILEQTGNMSVLPIKKNP